MRRIAAYTAALVIWSLTCSLSTAAEQSSADDSNLKSMTALRAEGGCYSYELLEPASEFLNGQPVRAALGWTTSGMWSDDELYLVDLTFRRIPKFRIQDPGRLLESGIELLKYSRDSQKKSERIVAPWYIYQRDDGGFLLIDLLNEDRSHILFVGPDGKLEDNPLPTQGRVQRGTNKGDISLREVFRMVPFGDGIIGAIDYEGHPPDGETWDTAFAYLDRNDVRILDLGKRLTETMVALGDKFYARDLTYLATLEGVCYILIYDRVPWIGKVQPGGSVIEPLESFPVGFGRIPELDATATTTRLSQSEAVQWIYDIYQNIETHRMPVGLYSWAGRLLVLVKTAKDPESGSTAWRLIEIDRETGQETGVTIELPTRAEHIALIPGHDFFAVIEKGGITVLDAYPRVALYRPVHSTVIFPESWISRPGIVPLKTRCERIAVAN